MTATPKPKRRGKEKRVFSLYWATTHHGSEDCFVVASTANAAARFFTQAEGFDGDDVDVEHIVDLPEDLQNGSGWREAPLGRLSRSAAYASDALIIACGGQVAEQRTDAVREMISAVTKDYVLAGRHFRAGDIVTVINREMEIQEPARLVALPGEKTGPTFPHWWEWELELTPHLEKRMEDRDFTEVDLRSMLEAATGYHGDVVEDRFVIETRFRGRAWEVIVEPDETDQLLVVVTAYGVDR